MIIKDIPYVNISPEVGFSISASLWMLLRKEGIEITPEALNELFCHSYMSDEFRDYIFSSGWTFSSYSVPETVKCALYVVNEKIKDVKASLFLTDFEAIRYSFIKRHIPVMITGFFPFINDKVVNSIIIKGYVDNYFVVNDPRGDASTLYRESNGENHLYDIEDLKKWTGNRETTLFRLSK